MDQPTVEQEHGSADQPWKNTDVWKRGLGMLLFGLVGGFARFVICIIAVFQFFSLLFTEKPNQQLLTFGQSLNTYLYQINQFLTINSELYPFPMSDWPSGAPEIINEDAIVKAETQD